MIQAELIKEMNQLAIEIQIERKRRAWEAWAIDYWNDENVAARAAKRATLVLEDLT
jgi:hypothetical protein